MKNLAVIVPFYNEKDFLETMAAEDNERLACQCICKGDVTLEVSD